MSARDRLNIDIYMWPHWWCNDLRARRECGRSWIRGPVGSNQRL